jgi:hypothetical protein
MSAELSKLIENELTQLFDIRTERLRKEKKLREDIMAAKKDIQLLIKMFSEDVPSISIPMGDENTLEWDHRIKRLIYHRHGVSQFIENVSELKLVEVRKHLHLLIKSAKNFYAD